LEDYNQLDSLFPISASLAYCAQQRLKVTREDRKAGEKPRETKRNQVKQREPHLFHVYDYENDRKMSHGFKIFQS
jgi:hypothetical protein